MQHPSYMLFGVVCVYVLGMYVNAMSPISVLMWCCFVPGSPVPPYSCPMLTVQVLVSALLFPGLKASLQRLQLEYVDVVFANRPDNNTPMEG